MRCCSHPAGGQSSDTGFMILGESRDLWASPENISVFGRNLLTARFGVFLVWFVLFFKRKNDVSSNMKSFALLFFFFCLKNTSHILFWVRLMQTAPSFPLTPSKSLGWAAFPEDGSPSTQAELQRRHMHTASAQFLEWFLCRKLLMDLSSLPGPLPGLLPGPS